MPAIDPYKEPSRTIDQKKLGRGGPADLKNKFSKPASSARGKKKKPEPEPETDEDFEQETDFDPGYDPELERDSGDDDLPDMPDPDMVQQVPPGYQPQPQPLPPQYQQPQYQPPQQQQYQQPEPTEAQALDEFGRQIQLFYTYNKFMHRYLETFKKYLFYQKELIIEQNELNEGRAPIQPQPQGNKKSARSLAEDPVILSDEARKHQRKQMIVKLGLAVLLIGGGAYFITMVKVPPMLIISTLLISFGSALVVSALFK